MYDDGSNEVRRIWSRRDDDERRPLTACVEDDDGSSKSEYRLLGRKKGVGEKIAPFQLAPETPLFCPRHARPRPCHRKVTQHTNVPSLTPFLPFSSRPFLQVPSDSSLLSLVSLSVYAANNTRSRMDRSALTIMHAVYLV